MEASEQGSARPVFDVPNILWYFGGIVAAGACLDLISNVSSGARGFWILLASVGAFAVFGWLSMQLGKGDWPIPSGVLAALSVVFVPIAGYALERILGIVSDTSFSTPDVPATPFTPGSEPETATSINESDPSPFQVFEWRWVLLTLLMVGAGMVVYRRTRFAFAYAPVAIGAIVTLFSLVPIVTSHPKSSTQAIWAIVFGLGFLAFGSRLDVAAGRREGFWFHLVGLVSLSVGLVEEALKHSSFGWIIILLSGVIILTGAGAFRRATWGLFGIAGVYGAITHYVTGWFGAIDTAAAMTAIGFLFVGLGMVFRSNEARLGELPLPWRSKRPASS